MIRTATASDLKEIEAIYENARAFMRRTGNPDQWGYDFPPVQLLEEDILLGRLSVLEDENGIGAVFALIGGEDPTYRVIEGAWLDPGPYHTLHRVASAGKAPGAFHRVCEAALRVDRHLRVDTHEHNLVMQRAILREGFTYCGIIHLLNGDPRLAYEITPAAPAQEKK